MHRIREYLIGIVLEALKRRDLQMDAALDELKGARGQAAANEYDRIIHGRLHGLTPDDDPVEIA